MVTLVALFAFGSPNLSAQGFDDHLHSSHSQRLDHGYWHQDVHVPDVVNLDHYSDQLASIARHLHEDAHKLSQDYEHSESIERHVDNVDRLQSHMHQILHHAVESGRQSMSLTAHVSEDLRQVKQLLTSLYGELQHQGFDGARTQDYYAMNHMRQILAQHAFPLVRQMEIELFGYALDGRGQHHFAGNGHGHAEHGGHPWMHPQHQPTYQQQTRRPVQGRPSVRIPVSPIQSILRSALRSIR
tara:strand:+ start:149266 stop:149991 length:726 start_codon:yes stop_codon:yes gene_type:complete